MPPCRTWSGPRRRRTSSARTSRASCGPTGSARTTSWCAARSGTSPGSGTRSCATSTSGSSTRTTEVLDTSAGVEWATWFRGGTLNLAAQCVDRWSAPHPGGDRGAVGGRGRRGPGVDLRGAAPRDRPARPRPAGARRPGLLDGRHLPADGAGDGRRRDGVLEARCDLGADLQRVRRRRGRCAAGGRRRARAPDGGRVAPQGEGRAHEGDRRPGRRARRLRRADRGVAPAAGRRDPVGSGARRRLVRVRRRRAARRRAVRRGASAVHRVHERDDGQAEGRRARPRRLPREDRGGGRLPGRPARGRGPALGDGPRLDHGALGDRRRARARLDGPAVRGGADPSRARIASGRSSSATASRRWASRRP